MKRNPDEILEDIKSGRRKIKQRRIGDFIFTKRSAQPLEDQNEKLELHQPANMMNNDLEYDSLELQHPTNKDRNISAPDNMINPVSPEILQQRTSELKSPNNTVPSLPT